MRARLLALFFVLAGCSSGQPPPSAESGAPLVKGSPGAKNGDPDYCNGAILCTDGEGDCDASSQCAAGLICANDVGGRWGMPSTYDVCVPATCINNKLDPGETGVDCGGPCGSCTPDCSAQGPNGGASFCTTTCKCGVGGGDCDTNADCQAGLVCGVDNGPKYGMPVGWDVCVPPSCANGKLDPGETTVDCGPPCGTTACGLPPIANAGGTVQPAPGAPASLFGSFTWQGRVDGQNATAKLKGSFR